MTKNVLLAVRMVYTTVGIAIFSLGILFSVKARLGVNPWTVFHMGLARHVGMTQGQVTQLFGLLIILTSYCLGIRPHLATIMNMVMVGGFFDIFNALNLLPTAANLTMGIWYIALSIALTGFGGAMYMSGGLGAGPRDSLMLALTTRTGQPVGRIRTGIEVTVLLIGWVLGGPVGAGTVILSLTSGPSVQVFFEFMRHITGMSSLAHQVMVIPVARRRTVQPEKV